MPKKYEKKSKKSKSVYINFYEKFLKSGYSITQVKRMNLRQFQKAFKPYGVNVRTNASMNAKKSILNQIKNDASYVINDYIIKENIQNKNLKQLLYNDANEKFNLKREDVKDIDEVIIKEKIKAKGQYGVIVLTDLKDYKEYYLKYHDDKSLEKRLQEIIRDYNITSYITHFRGIYMYKRYITKEFEERLDTYGLS